MPILFHDLGQDVPDPVENSPFWQVAWYDNLPFPSGLAWVTVGSTGERAVMEYVLVDDERRRRGIAKALIVASRERWPGLYLNIAINPAGLALARHFEPRMRPEDVFPREAIARFLQDGLTREQIDDLAEKAQDGFDTLTMLPPDDEPAE